MTTSISIDKNTRDRAAAQAKEDKLSMSAVMRILLSDYAEGKIEIGTRIQDQTDVQVIKVDKKTQGLMDEVIHEWRKAK